MAQITRRQFQDAIEEAIVVNDRYSDVVLTPEERSALRLVGLTASKCTRVSSECCPARQAGIWQTDAGRVMEFACAFDTITGEIVGGEHRLEVC